MKRISFTIAIAVIALFALSNSGTNAVNKTFAERFIVDGKPGKMGDSGTYNFDKAHSFISFRVKHMGLVEVPGFFRDFTGSVNFDSADVTRSTVEFKAKAASIDTGVAPRDKHLRTADFFDVEKYPDLTFKSTKVEKKGKNWIVTGDLTMRGVTKSISFPFQIAGWLPADEHSGGKMGIAAETTINRRDFGVNYGNNLPSGIAAVSDDVKIILQIEAGKAKAATAKAE
ncbi:MAG TPA: YceI family protein [Pyrinomonadaceae bacterium]|nr:YceI family protein [Pyrinomonadaceae bacterium]